MSWDAKNFDKPLILLEFKTVRDAIEKNAYKPDEDIAKFMADDPSSELYIQRLSEAGLLKEACDFLCYAIHRRAGAWWGCLRVKDFKEEKVKYKDYKSPLKQKHEDAMAKIAGFVQQAKAASEKDKAIVAGYNAKVAEIGNDIKTKTFTDPADLRTKIQEGIKKKLPLDQVKLLAQQLQATIAALPPERKARLDANLARVDAKFIEKFGKPYKEFLQETLEKALNPPVPPQTPSPMDVAEEKLKSNITEIKAGIKEQMSIFPLKIPGLPKAPSKERVDAAYEAALRWVMAPTDINARLSCEAGLAAGTNVEGLLAQTAFWCGNNLAPANVKIQIVPPPGLAAKGLLSTLYGCAMSKEGALSYDDRYNLHLKTGIEVAQGINLWGDEFKNQFTPFDWEGKEGFGRHFATRMDAPPTPKEFKDSELPTEEPEKAATKRVEKPKQMQEDELAREPKEDKVSTEQTKRQVPLDGFLNSEERRNAIRPTDKNENNN